jgi:hypothetical protein
MQESLRKNQGDNKFNKTDSIHNVDKKNEMSKDKSVCDETSNLKNVPALMEKKMRVKITKKFNKNLAPRKRSTSPKEVKELQVKNNMNEDKNNKKDAVTQKERKPSNSKK